MNRACGLLAVLCFGFSPACGRETPQKPVTVGEALALEYHQPEHWNETVAEAGRLYREGHPEQSLALFQGVVDANPKFADGYFSLAGNYVDMAHGLDGDPAAADRRRQYLEQAAVNYEKFHDLMTDADDKAQGTDQLVNVFGPRGLNQIDKAVRYARRYVEELPTKADGYGKLAAMLRQQGDYDRATAVLLDAKSKISTANGDAFDLAKAYIEHVQKSPDLDPATAARFLAEASAARDRLLADADSDWRSLGTILKTDILDAQAHAR
jgi:tetratricopeptide (TPR) repeat protein